MTVREKRKGKKKRWWRAGFSCFGDSNAFELDGTNMELGRKSVRKRVWSRLARKKKTVPVEIAGDSMDCEMMRRASDGKKENHCRGQSKPEACPDQNKKQKQQKKVSSNKQTNDVSKLPSQQIASRCEILSKSAPLYRILDPVQTQTRIRSSQCNSPESSHHSTQEISPTKTDHHRRSTGEIGSSKVVPIIIVAVILVLLFGRGFAIFCMCVYFYVVSRFKSELTESKIQIKKGNEEIDLDSEKHKKMVVLRGFLDRGKKNTATSLRSFST